MKSNFQINEHRQKGNYSNYLFEKAFHFTWNLTRVCQPFQLVSCDTFFYIDYFSQISLTVGQSLTFAVVYFCHFTLQNSTSWEALEGNMIWTVSFMPNQIIFTSVRSRFWIVHCRVWVVFSLNQCLVDLLKSVFTDRRFWSRIFNRT